MLSGRELNMEDYVGIVRRRIWLLLIPLILGPILALVIAKKLPPKYTSVSEILIEEPKVPTNFVPSVQGKDLVSQLATMEEQIRSRSRLEPIIERYGLYKSDINKVPMEQLIDRMNKAIVIQPVAFSNGMLGTSSAKDQVPGFEIRFTAETPQLAQAVCTEITSMFIDAHSRLQMNRAQGTADFIAVQLQQGKQKLDEEDARLAAFKRQYFGSLPDQEQATLQYLATLTTQLNALNGDMSRDQQDETYTESMLNEQLTAWKAQRSGGVSNPDTLQQQLNAAEENLMALRTRFTDSYPDVIKAKQEVDALKKRMASEEAPGKANQSKTGDKNLLNPALEPPQISQLRAQLRAVKDAMKNNMAQQARIRQEINAQEAKLKLTPAVEQQYQGITRDYQTALAFYNSLLQKEDESQMSTSLERRQEGEQFQVLDPADLPQKPSFPNLLGFAGGGLLVGLALGSGLVFLFEMRDKALRDERDIEFFMHVPTLGMIPEIAQGQSNKSLFNRKRKALKEAEKTLAS
jgi:polysaccharide chain length determinant protein (PEP-CTERM system associated)